MLTEFSKDKSRKPFITYTVIVFAVVLTGVNISNNLFEEFLLKSEILRMFLLPFHHGFNFPSSILHLIFSILFFGYFGKVVEKILGRGYYFILLLLAYITYVSLQYIFGMSGYGLTPITFCIVVYAFATMTEAKNIKPRVVHESYFIRVNSLGIAFILSSLLLFSFLPIFYNIQDTTLVKGVFDGNFLHLIEILLGLISLVFFRRKIRMNWLRFNKRKSFLSKSKVKS